MAQKTFTLGATKSSYKWHIIKSDQPSESWYSHEILAKSGQTCPSGTYSNTTHYAEFVTN